MSDVFLYESTQEQADSLTVAGRPLAELIGEICDLYLEDDRPWGCAGSRCFALEEVDYVE